MKQKKMLALTLSQLEQLYRHELPELVSIAVQSDDAEAFKANLTEYIAGHPEVDSEAGKQIRLLIEFDGQEVHELSIGEQLPIVNFINAAFLPHGTMGRGNGNGPVHRLVPAVQTPPPASPHPALRTENQNPDRTLAQRTG